MRGWRKKFSGSCKNKSDLEGKVGKDKWRRSGLEEREHSWRM